LTDIVLAVPCGAASFQRAKEQASPEVAARVREWPAVTVFIGSVAYVPLRSDWMPPKERRTADGVEVLLAGRWPAEVQAAIDGGNAIRIGASLMETLWKEIFGTSTYGLSEKCDGEQSKAPAVAQEPLRLPDAVPGPVRDRSSVAPLQDSQDVHNKGSPTAAESAGDLESTASAGDAHSLVTSPRLQHVDGWKWSTVISEIRAWAQYYPEPIPDDNTLTEAEAKMLLKTILQHPAVIAAEEQHEDEGAARRAEYRDARVIQYAIPVGVALPDPTPPMIGQEFSCTDDGNGDRLVAQYKDAIRYCKTFDGWFIWNGQRWERDETCRMLALARRVARTIYIEASTAGDDRREKVGKWALASGMLARLKAMTTCACPAVAVTPDAFDAHPTLLNCQNGTLELDTLIFRAARREDLLTKCCGVDYDPTAACPRWLAHLDLIFGGDVEVIGGFQQMAGYSLLDGNPEQVMFILLGRGKNGKSVTLRVLSEVLGDYAVNIAAESLMVKRNDTIRSDLARLMGARLVTSAEGGEGAALDEGAVKQLTGFDDKITVARKYENEFEFTPSAKIWFATNHAPKIRGTDDGIWRRIWLIPFEVQIAEERRDPQITEKLLQEKQGILNWMLDGLRQYHAQGHRLQPAAKIVAATRAYRRESDVFGRFLADEMVFDPRGSLDRAALYRIYTGWCQEEGEMPVAARTIAKYLRERQILDAKRGGARCWIGIRLKDTMEAERDAAAGSTQAGL